MRRKHYAKGLAYVLAFSLAAGNAMPALAQTPGSSNVLDRTDESSEEEKGEGGSSEEESKGEETGGKKPGKATGSNANKDEDDGDSGSDNGNDDDESMKDEEELEDDRDLSGKKDDIPLATDSEADPELWEGDLSEVPAINSSEFTSWFFDNAENELLWDFVMEIMEDDSHELYKDFMEWFNAHEKRVLKAYEEFFGIKLYTSATGDLWTHWNSDMDFVGDGTEDSPYEIGSLSELMGLSERVAAGEDFAGQHFELISDIDIGGLEVNSGNWNPIGWYQNKADLGGAVDHVFSGHFDGAGNTIYGLKFVDMKYDYNNLGLFGVVEDAVIENLTLEADQVNGSDNVALLVGEVKGDSQIRNVTVTGEVYANGDVGGIAGQVTGSASDRVTIENCIAEGVVLNSEGRDAFVGGIAGNVQYADLVDNTVSTQDGDTDRIQGKGYVGGIAGRINHANLYNSEVSGSIGGNGTTAVGGILGLYEDGNVIVARFDGETGKTNQGTSSHEGTFIGTRESRSKFTCGTGKKDNCSYLFAADEASAKNVIGSNIDNDNSFTDDAHIGYMEDHGVRYVTIAGSKGIPCGERYFYEELEDGIRYIITQKLGRDVTVDYAKGMDFTIDHFAPGHNGQPIRGYLVSIPRIDEYDAKGTPDTDVAVLTALGRTNNSFYRVIDKDHPSAVAPGDVISVTTAPKNKDGNRYQMVYSEFEEGSVEPPTYLDENGDHVPMAYVAGGSYTFEMPECATELNVKYIKVTTELAMNPKETTIEVTQTRSGDRKNPEVVTEVHNNGNLIAREINGTPDASVKVNPISITATHNGQGSASDRTVKWSVDDKNLLTNLSESGWTEKAASIIPNMKSNFIQDIIASETKKQADNGYQTPIENKIYSDVAVVTASTNPATSDGNKEVIGNTKVTVTFQIVDHTQIKVEGLNLNHTAETFTITRKLTGDRKNPQESYSIDNSLLLSATLFPSGTFYKNVQWTVSEDDGGDKAVSITPKGTNTQDCDVKVLFTEDGLDNPSWIQDVINRDNAAKAADNGYKKLDGSATQTATVTATSEDQTHGVQSASCKITINFVTVDETVIHPEGITLNKTAVEYPLTYVYEGDTQSKIKAKKGFGEKDTLVATVLPDIEDTEAHKPYDRTVIWESTDSEAVRVENGTITVNDNAQWIKDALKKAPYAAEKTVTVTAKTADGENVATCDVTLKFRAETIVADRNAETFDIVLTKTGRRSNPTLTWSGNEAKKFTAELFTEKNGLTKVWSSSDAAVLTVDKDGNVVPVVTDKDGKVIASWIDAAMQKYPYTASMDAMITVAASDNSMQDTIPVKLNFSVVDNTYSSGGSGGGGGGGGGGSSSGGVTPGGRVNTTVKAPGAVTGTWVQNAAGKWLFADSKRSYANEWALIHNPYAAMGQPTVSWFRFDKDGFMVTGWYQNEQGNWFYLNPVSDNTIGRMLTGWQLIDGKRYYFTEETGGSEGCLKTGWHWIDSNKDGVAECYYLNPADRGALLANTTTPDNYTVDNEGRWVVDGNIQTKSTEEPTNR